VTINNKTGNIPENEQEMEMKCGARKVTNPPGIVKLFNSYFF
jgi:hypothetical protein